MSQTVDGRAFPGGIAALVAGVRWLSFCRFCRRAASRMGEMIEQGRPQPLDGRLLAGRPAGDRYRRPVPSSLVIRLRHGLGWGGTLASFAGMSITTAAGYLMGRYSAAPVGRLLDQRVRNAGSFAPSHGVAAVGAAPRPSWGGVGDFSGGVEAAGGRVAAVTASATRGLRRVCRDRPWGDLSIVSPAFLVAMAGPVMIGRPAQNCGGVPGGRHKRAGTWNVNVRCRALFDLASAYYDRRSLCPLEAISSPASGRLRTASAET